MKRVRRRLGSVAALAVTVVAACGGNGSEQSHPRHPTGPASPSAVRGGTLTVYDHTDFGHLDPGEAYDAVDYEVIYATQRPLFSYRPADAEHLSPDLASGPAIVSRNGRTVTVHLRHGVRFSPPVDREVTSADVAYAIERGANPNVATPYFPAYFSDIVGAAKASGGPIPGIVTPDRYTIIFHLTRSEARCSPKLCHCPSPLQYPGRLPLRWTLGSQPPTARSTSSRPGPTCSRRPPQGGFSGSAISQGDRRPSSATRTGARAPTPVPRT